MSHAKRKIAFIGHPLNMTALSVMTGFPRAIMDVVGKNRIKTLLMKCRPFVFARQRHMVSRAGAVIDFMAIACPYLPEQLVAVGEEKALRDGLSCVELAARRVPCQWLWCDIMMGAVLIFFASRRRHTRS